MNTNRRNFLAVGVGAVALSAAPAAASAATPALAAIIAKYRAAHDAYDAACEADESESELSRIHAEESAALDALCSYPIASTEDARAKAVVLLEYCEYFALPEDCYTALLQSFVS